MFKICDILIYSVNLGVLIRKGDYFYIMADFHSVFSLIIVQLSYTWLLILFQLKIYL